MPYCHILCVVSVHPSHALFNRQLLMPHLHYRWYIRQLELLLSGGTTSMNATYLPTFGYQAVFKKIFNNVKDIHLIKFQYRLIHRILGRKDILCKMSRKIQIPAEYVSVSQRH